MKLLWQRLRHMLTPLAGADQTVNLAGNAGFVEIAQRALTTFDTRVRPDFGQVAA